MKVPESVNEGLKLAGGVSACAGGAITVITAVVGAIKILKSREKIAYMIAGNILENNPGLTERTLDGVVRRNLNSDEYYSSLEYSEKGAVTELVMKKLLKEIRKEAVTC